jgi:hypothetical protein
MVRPCGKDEASIVSRRMGPTRFLIKIVGSIEKQQQEELRF